VLVRAEAGDRGQNLAIRRWRAGWRPARPHERARPTLLGRNGTMMSDKERRDFEAGLSSEVDAWLRGDTSRRKFLTRFALLSGVALLSGWMMQMPGWARAAVQLAQAQMADPSTPLGQAQAAALKASTDGPTDGSAYRAVQAAKAHKGITINMTYEAGLQALEPRNYSGPVWKDLTGITSNII